MSADIEEAADALAVDPGDLINEDIADVGVRAPLPIPLGTTLTLRTGEVGDEGVFALKTIPASWDAAGPSGDGLENYLVPGPGLGMGEDRELLLDKILDVTPLRTEGLGLLVGETVCALVYKSDISMNYDPLEGSLKGANRGLLAFDVLSVGLPDDPVLPELTVQVMDAEEACEASGLELLEGAPAPISSSEPSP